MSTNKVYGDAPNEIPSRTPTRWNTPAPRLPRHLRKLRIDRTLPLSRRLEASADLVAGVRPLLNMNVGIFRGAASPALLIPASSSTASSRSREIHTHRREIQRLRLQGKQVRDNIHSHDVVRAIENSANPRPGEVYNMGVPRNSVSMLEAIEKIEQLLEKTQLDLRGRKSQGRSHLLHFRPAQIQIPLFELANYQESR